MFWLSMYISQVGIYIQQHVLIVSYMTAMKSVFFGILTVFFKWKLLQVTSSSQVIPSLPGELKENPPGRLKMEAQNWCLGSMFDVSRRYFQVPVVSLRGVYFFFLLKWTLFIEFLNFCGIYGIAYELWHVFFFWFNWSYPFASFVTVPLWSSQARTCQSEKQSGWKAPSEEGA